MAVATSAASGASLRALRKLLTAQVAVLAALDSERWDWEDDELRRFRVAVRRLRSQLRAGLPLLDAGWARELRDELAWLGRAAGRARDLDVLLASLREVAAHFEPGERFLLARPLQQLERERASARQAFLGDLESDRCRQLVGRLQREVPQAPAGGAADPKLSEIAAAAFRRLSKCGRRLDAGATDDELHRLRLEVKRARYVAELAVPEAGKPALRFVGRAKVLQDILGAHQDAALAESRLRLLLGSSLGSRWALPGGRLIEYQHARRQEAREAWPGAWWQLDQAGRAAFGQTLKRMLSTSPSATA